MIEKDNNTLKAYTGPLSRTLREEYTIGEEYYRGDVKRGLRNSDGTGVLVGVSKVGSVQGYLIQDGQRIPAPGRLYYRGIDLYDIVGAHREAGTFGYEEVAYLLLMGYLPSRPELDHFKDIMNQARKLPKGFTEGMIMHHPSQNIMNELARGVLSLYSYDPDPDNTSIENLLLQSVRLYCHERMGLPIPLHGFFERPFAAAQYEPRRRLLQKTELSFKSRVFQSFDLRYPTPNVVQCYQSPGTYQQKRGTPRQCMAQRSTQRHPKQIGHSHSRYHN